MKFQPLLGNVLVRVATEADRKSAGGIYIPTTASQDNQVVGVVEGVGEGVPMDKGMLRPLVVKVGDKVLIQQDRALALTGNPGLFMLPESNLLAIVTD
jgi:chaperonin GroES